MSTYHLHQQRMTVIVKPTNACNANCVYCCADCEVGDRARMSDTVLKTFFIRVGEYAQCANLNEIEIIWHGGEPLLMGKKFYDQERMYSQKYLRDVKVQHAMQTNLLLFDTEYADLFKSMNLRLSTSVDPVSGIRIFKNGRDYLDLWVEKFKIGLARDFSVGLICVIHKKHLHQLDKFFQFFENIYVWSGGKSSVRYNVLYSGGRAQGEQLCEDLEVTPEEWGETLIRLWRMWEASGRIMRHVPPMSEWATLFQNYSSSVNCAFRENCLDGWMGIDHEGYVFNCGRHMDSGQPFGNLRNNPITSILCNPDRLRWLKRPETLRCGGCKDCTIWDKCHGGCPDDGYLWTGDYLSKTHWCISHQKFYKEVFANHA